MYAAATEPVLRILTTYSGALLAGALTTLQLASIAWIGVLVSRDSLLFSSARFPLLDELTSALERRNRAEMVRVFATITQARRELVVNDDERDFESIADRGFELDSGIVT